MSKVKIGILGAGFIAKVHVDNLKKDERAEVVGVVDLYLEKAQALAKEAGLKRRPSAPWRKYAPSG